jgi:hypothetical protein
MQDTCYEVIFGNGSSVFVNEDRLDVFQSHLDPNEYEVKASNKVPDNVDVYNAAFSSLVGIMNAKREEPYRETYINDYPEEFFEYLFPNTKDETFN